MVLLGSASLCGTKYGSLNQDFAIYKTIDKHDEPPETARKFNGDRKAANSDTHPAQSESTTGTIYIAAVFDGHGMLGEAAAEVAGKTMCRFLETELKALLRKRGATCLRDCGKSRVQDVVHRGFQEAHQDILELYRAAPPQYKFPTGSTAEQTYTLQTAQDTTEQENVAPVYLHPTLGPRLVEFGTTASVVILDGDLAIVAHVGDSSVCAGSLTRDQSIDAIQVTNPHSGTNEQERFRVAEMLLEDPMIHMASLREDGYLEVTNLGGISATVALSMTRALGHLHLEPYGVIAKPDMAFLDLKDDDFCILLATDGVWDSFSPREATALVCEALVDGASADEAMHTLCAEAIDLSNTTNGHSDNTSGILVFFGEGLLPSDDDYDPFSSD